LKKTKSLFCLILKGLSIAVFTIVATHGLAFALTQVLPAAAEIMLGLYGAKHDVLTELSKLIASRSYFDMLSGLFTLDFGVSTDGVLVRSELSQHLLISLPRLGLALFFVIIITFISLTISERVQRTLNPMFSYILFFPVYGIPFLLFVFVLISGARLDSASTIPWIASALAIAIPPAALLSIQARGIKNNNFKSQHAISLLSMGISPRRLNYILLNNLIYEISPSLEKATTGVISGLIFSELVFGMPGLGALTIRSIRRADTELLLGVIVVFTGIICISRLISTITVSFYDKTS
jgi:ABC-type dipeptide/oligopeptide/nickel transport system permease component